MFFEIGVMNVDYKKEIIKLLDKINDTWILGRIYLFVVGMMKEE